MTQFLLLRLTSAYYIKLDILNLLHAETPGVPSAYGATLYKSMKKMYYQIVYNLVSIPLSKNAYIKITEHYSQW